MNAVISCSGTSIVIAANPTKVGWYTASVTHDNVDIKNSPKANAIQVVVGLRTTPLVHQLCGVLYYTSRELQSWCAGVLYGRRGMSDKDTAASDNRAYPYGHRR